jgi:hypothetical protein
MTEASPGSTAHGRTRALRVPSLSVSKRVGDPAAAHREVQKLARKSRPWQAGTVAAVGVLAGVALGLEHLAPSPAVFFASRMTRVGEQAL